MMLHVGNPSVALPKSVMVVRWVLFGLVVLATTTSSTTTTRMLSIGRNVLVSGFRPLPKSARRRTTPRTGTAANTSMGTTNRRQTNTHHPRRHLGFTASASTSSPGTRSRRRRTGVVVQNVYDDWRSDAVVETMHLDAENVQYCLEEFINSRYGQTMFGCHDEPASIGVTGRITYVEVCGPEVTLRLEGHFWHRRATVLGRAATYLNARMPEVTDVVVADRDELQDYDEIIDEENGEVLFQTDRRAPDYNGDRATMEYQGIDPDVRGPFPTGPMGPGTMINPA